MKFIINRGKNSDSLWSEIAENEGNLSQEQINEIIWLRQDGDTRITLKVIPHPENDLLSQSIFTFPEDIVKSLQLQSNWTPD
jgi:hypothetical protein